MAFDSHKSSLVRRKETIVNDDAVLKLRRDLEQDELSANISSEVRMKQLLKPTVLRSLVNFFKPAK